MIKPFEQVNLALAIGWDKICTVCHQSPCASDCQAACCR